MPTTTGVPQATKFNSSSVLRHTNIVCGSDRSGLDNGNKSLSTGGYGLSGSDNASHNSGFEGRSLSTADANGSNKWQVILNAVPTITRSKMPFTSKTKNKVSSRCDTFLFHLYLYSFNLIFV